MGLWFDETYKGRVRLGLHVQRTLFHGQSPYQTVDIVDTEPYGPTLLLDNAMMTSIADEFFYHEMLVHPALTTAPSIKRVLVVGGGDGGTVREVLRYREVEQVTMCEIDAMVTDACKVHLSEFKVPWEDPRLTLHFADAVAFLKAPGELFDVILIDGSDPVGPAEGLITTSFYETCKKRLAPGGVIALQSEAPLLMQDDFVRIVKALREVFPKVRPYFGPVLIYPSGSWSFTFATNGDVDPLAPRAERLAQIEATCRYYNRDIHQAAFAQPNYVRKALGDR